MLRFGGVCWIWLHAPRSLGPQPRAGRVGAVVSAGLGVLVFANGYFVNDEVLWQILNPARMLAAIAWSAGASQTNIATAKNSESSGAG